VLVLVRGEQGREQAALGVVGPAVRRADELVDARRRRDDDERARAEQREREPRHRLALGQREHGLQAALRAAEEVVLGVEHGLVHGPPARSRA
jgi:hypothetical protein